MAYQPFHFAPTRWICLVIIEVYSFQVLGNPRVCQNGRAIISVRERNGNAVVMWSSMRMKIEVLTKKQGCVPMVVPQEGISKRA